MRWDLQSKKLLRTLKKTHKDAVQHICVSPDGQYLLTVGADNIVKVWDMYMRGSSPPAFQSFVLPNGACKGVVFLHDMSRIIAASSNGIVTWTFRGKVHEIHSSGRRRTTPRYEFEGEGERKVPEGYMYMSRFAEEPAIDYDTSDANTGSSVPSGDSARSSSGESPSGIIDREAGTEEDSSDLLPTTLYRSSRDEATASAEAAVGESPARSPRSLKSRGTDPQVPPLRMGRGSAALKATRGGRNGGGAGHLC